MIINSYAFASALTNFALAATVSSSHSFNETSHPLASVKDGLRHTNNLWDSGVGWIAGEVPSGGVNIWVEYDFGTDKHITRLDAIGLKSDSNPDYNTDPTLTDTNTEGTLFKDFKWQSWNGSSYDDIAATITTGNDKVWKQFTGLSVTTSKVRFICSASWGGWLALIELEAWG